MDSIRYVKDSLNDNPVFRQEIFGWGWGINLEVVLLMYYIGCGLLQEHMIWAWLSLRELNFETCLLGITQYTV